MLTLDQVEHLHKIAVYAERQFEALVSLVDDPENERQQEFERKATKDLVESVVDAWTAQIDDGQIGAVIVGAKRRLVKRWKAAYEAEGKVPALRVDIGERLLAEWYGTRVEIDGWSAIRPARRT